LSSGRLSAAMTIEVKRWEGKAGKSGYPEIKEEVWLLQGKILSVFLPLYDACLWWWRWLLYGTFTQLQFGCYLFVYL